jgi:hypothetical protein
MFLLSPELTVTLLCSPVEDTSLLTSVFESTFNASLMVLKTMFVIHLMLPKVELHIVPWVTGGYSELKQLGCLVLLLR